MGLSLGSIGAAVNPVAAIGTLAAGGGQVLGAYMGKRANDKAINAASAQAAATLAQQQRMYDEYRRMTDPYRRQLQGMVDNPQTSPLARLRQVEGEKAINRALSARGMRDSSFAVNQLSDFNRRNFAEDYQQKLGILGSLSGIGQLPGVMQNQSNALGQAGAIQGNLELARGQNRGQLYNSIGNAFGNTLQAGSMLAGYNNWFGGGGSGNGTIANDVYAG